MAYIGRNTDKLSNIEVLDAITFDGSSSYTLQKNSVNFTPSSANNVLVSIDGVVQANNFTVSGSTIDFGVAVPSTSTCDWIYHIGVGLITTPADGTVTTGKIQDAAVTSAKLFSGFANGITMADQWRLTTSTNAGTDADITTNWERVDDASWGGIGTGLTESSGIFSFAQTGLYIILANFLIQLDNADVLALIRLKVTTDNSTYTTVNEIYSGISSGGIDATVGNTHIFNVTNTSTHKFAFSTGSFSGTTFVSGNTDRTRSGFTILRIGDSV